MDTGLLFAHGAGAPSSSPWMVGWTARLGALGAVRPFDYPYMQRPGRRPPDRLPTLIEAHREQVRALREAHERIVLIGKSMGSRVGCHLALEESVTALVCFGYPLRSPSGKMRDEVLLALDTPVLFIQGTRDKLCPLDLLAETRAAMRAASQLHVVETGDHSLQITRTHAKRSQTSQADADAGMLAAIETFLATI